MLLWPCEKDGVRSHAELFSEGGSSLLLIESRLLLDVNVCLSVNKYLYLISHFFTGSLL